MIPRPQHFGDRAPFPCYRPGIVRIFQETLLEALLLSAGGRAHYPGKQSHASIEDHHGAKLAAREDVVADRDLFERSRVEDSLVEPLEAAGEEDDALAGGEFANTGLRQRLASRGERHHRPPVSNTVERRGNDVRTEHHPRPATRGRVVDAAVLVGREFADVLRFEAPNALLESATGETCAERSRKHVRIKGEDGRKEGHRGTAAITIHWAAHGRANPGLSDNRRRTCGPDRRDLSRALPPRHSPRRCRQKPRLVDSMHAQCPRLPRWNRRNGAAPADARSDVQIWREGRERIRHEAGTG